MSKELLKTQLRENQEGRCILSKTKLKSETKYFDTDRKKPKYKGGIYTINNTRVVDPIAHMQRHNTYKLRSPELVELKTLIDGREQIRKLLNSLNNRILADSRRVDHIDEQTKKWITLQISIIDKQLKYQDKIINKFIKNYDLPICKSAQQIRGIGTITIAYCLVYLDIYKADYPSSFWKYCGYDKASYERYEKGVSGGGNKILRTILYNTAISIIKLGSPYKEVYINEKLKLENSLKLTKTRNTQGKLIECPWKDTKPCHRHGAAMRKMIKHFLADLWLVWRTLEGLPIKSLYVEDKLGHTGIIKPEERGWIY